MMSHGRTDLGQDWPEDLQRCISRMLYANCANESQPTVGGLTDDVKGKGLAWMHRQSAALECRTTSYTYFSALYTCNVIIIIIIFGVACKHHRLLGLQSATLSVPTHVITEIDLDLDYRPGRFILHTYIRVHCATI